MDPLEQIKKDIQTILTRNSRVEADKAWETSWARKALVLVTTYILASLVMYVIGVPHFYINSLIPTLGFFLSTLSFPIVKSWWVQEYMNKNKSL
jgi:biotin transporter BioY